jgi:PhnB protein
MTAEKPYVAPWGGVLTPYICPRSCADAIDWYVSLFAAVEQGERYVTDGKVGHAVLEIDGALLMLSDSFPEYGAEAPPEGNRTATYALYLHVPDVDETLAAAGRAGADVHRPPEDQPYGARMGAMIDPFGVRWMIATHGASAERAPA